MAGALGAAGSRLASSPASAAAAQDTVTPVNITAKETMQLGKSGMLFMQRFCVQSTEVCALQLPLHTSLHGPWQASGLADHNVALRTLYRVM